MLDLTVNVKVNPITKRKLEKIAADWGVQPSSIYRLAFYSFLELNRQGPPDLMRKLADMKAHGGRMPEDFLVDGGIEVRE